MNLAKLNLRDIAQITNIDLDKVILLKAVRQTPYKIDPPKRFWMNKYKKNIKPLSHEVE
ncbi:MAG: hypothetical protein NE330_10240 [Lentisphaeraceae bacterium]|nr:hypothetical protein [Lentisphaeraceae bacterium]